MGINVYQNALDLCRVGDWAKAEALFNTLPNDSVCQIYAQQCRNAQTLGSWDSVWLLENK